MTTYLIRGHGWRDEGEVNEVRVEDNMATGEVLPQAGILLELLQQHLQYVQQIFRLFLTSNVCIILNMRK